MAPRGPTGADGDNLGDALEMFARVAEAQLQTLGESDRALERTHLLGSAVAPGLAERAFAFEIEHGDDVLERLLEHALEGEFTFEGSDGPRRVSLRAKADRIDLLADGTLRVVDYKLGKAPKTSRALQLPVYGVCAQQALEGHRGRSWTLSKAGYVAFREKNSCGARVGSALDKACGQGQSVPRCGGRSERCSFPRSRTSAFSARAADSPPVPERLRGRMTEPLPLDTRRTARRGMRRAPSWPGIDVTPRARVCCRIPATTSCSRPRRHRQDLRARVRYVTF